MEDKETIGCFIQLDPTNGKVHPIAPGNVSSLTPDHRCNACWYTSGYRYLWIDPRNIKTHSITWTKAFRYAKAMEHGDHFPPVKAARSVIGQLLAKNGAHRAHAACMAGVRLLIKVKEDRSSAPAPEFLRMRQLRNQANRKSKG